jgi:WD40 repeat protein
VLLSPDGATIFSGGWDGFVGQPGCMRFWDAATGDLIGAAGAAKDYVRAADWSKDGARLAVSVTASDGSSSRIEILDTTTGATVAFLRDLTRAWEWGTESIAFDPPAQNVFWIDNRTGMAHLADAHTGAVRKSRRVFNAIGIASRVAWNPDGSLIAVNNVNNAKEPTIDLLDAQSLDLVRQWLHGSSATITSLSFSPDGRRILAGSTARTIRIWDVATGTLVHELVGHGNEVLCATYSPDGKRIASGGRDGNVRIWDAATFDPLARLGGHKDYVYSLAWGPDSQQLISGSADHTVRIWDTVPMKDRVRTRRDRQALLAKLEPKVRQLFTDFGEAAKVAETVKADASLSPRERQVALQVVLRISLDRLNAAAEPRP